MGVLVFTDDLLPVAYIFTIFVAFQVYNLTYSLYYYILQLALLDLAYIPSSSILSGSHHLHCAGDLLKASQYCVGMS